MNRTIAVRVVSQAHGRQKHEAREHVWILPTTIQSSKVSLHPSLSTRQLVIVPQDFVPEPLTVHRQDCVDLDSRALVVRVPSPKTPETVQRSWTG
jgi:hypothetical protein